MILSYPGLFKNIPHVWFLRLYSLIKNPQYDFPKMRGGGQRPFGTFPKIHPFWEGDASLMGTFASRNGDPKSAFLKIDQNKPVDISARASI